MRFARVAAFSLIASPLADSRSASICRRMPSNSLPARLKGSAFSHRPRISLSTCASRLAARTRFFSCSRIASRDSGATWKAASKRFLASSSCALKPSSSALQIVALLCLARQLALLPFQLALLELQVLVGDLDKTLALLLLDVEDVARQPVDVLDAQRRLQRRLQAHFGMVIGGDLLNLLAVEEEELGDARRNRRADEVLPDFLVLHRHPLAVAHHHQPLGQIARLRLAHRAGASRSA